MTTKMVKFSVGLLNSPQWSDPWGDHPYVLDETGHLHVPLCGLLVEEEGMTRFHGDFEFLAEKLDAASCLRCLPSARVYVVLRDGRIRYAPAGPIVVGDDGRLTARVALASL